MKLFTCLFLFCSFIVNAQTKEFKNDSLKNIKTKKTFFKRTTVPRILIGSGIILTGTALENDIQHDVRNFVGSDFATTIDDHLWKVPLAQMYTADLLGIESKNHWFDQSKNAFIAHTINKHVTRALKDLFGKERPNGYNNVSFPSGHTSKAFTSATILYEEFKDTNPWLAYSGYVFASTTGFLRIANNAHYLSDVLAGAGLGILITKLVYHFDYLFDWNPFKNSKDSKESFNITPVFNSQTVGLAAIVQF